MAATETKTSEKLKQGRLNLSKGGKPSAICCCVVSISVFVVFMIGTNVLITRDNHQGDTHDKTTHHKHGRQMQVYRRPELKQNRSGLKKKNDGKSRIKRHRKKSSKGRGRGQHRINDYVHKGEGDNDSSVDDADNRPTFVLHVGPPKTGTTSIQCGLTKISDVLADLDRTYYLGKACWSARFGVMKNGELMNFKTHNTVVNEIGHTKTGEGVVHLKNRLKYHHGVGNTLLMSEEALAWRFDKFKNLARMLKEWKPVVSVSYRRYHEWIPSRYGHDFNVEYTHSKWPYERNPKRYREVPTVAEYIKFELDGMEQQAPRELFSEHSKHMTISTIQRYMPYFQTFVVYPFHNNSTSDMLTNFVCNGLPTKAGSKTCEILRNTSVTESEQKKERPPASANVTPPGQMDALRLVREAIRRGWIGQRPPGMPPFVEAEDTDSEDQSMYEHRLDHNKVAIETRRQLVNLYSSVKGVDTLQKSADIIGYKPPLICMDEKLHDRLLHATILFEEHLILEGYLPSPLDEIELREHFNKSVIKQKFCDLDVDKVLENPFWEEFFTFLNTLDRSVKLTELRKYMIEES